MQSPSRAPVSAPNSHRQISRGRVALRDVAHAVTARVAGTRLGPRRAVTRMHVIAVALLLSQLCACGLYGPVIPRRPPTGIDLNRASAEEIADLPGLSDEDAERIVSNRPYATKDDLVRRGVLTEQRFEAIQNRFYLSRPSSEPLGPRV